jgi:hypothetical protein
MKTLALIILCLAATGCSTAQLHAYADAQDRKDSCQTQEFSPRTGERLKPQGYGVRDFPDWCGASRGKTRITNTQGQTVGYIR